ncbi:MAG TPA: hypothetical protein VN688_28015, partial [Gemmataceae bacterium]|nr:hypothetical protein [Gemmataceae bacterium]
APDGKTLVTGGRASSLVQVWNAATGSELFRQQALPTKQVSMVTMRNPGAQFPVIQQRVTQGAAGIRTLAFSRDSKQLALGLADGTLRLWDALTWQERGEAPGQGTIDGVVFAADGKTLATIAKDGAVMLWELPRTPKNVKRQASKR